MNFKIAVEGINGYPDGRNRRSSGEYRLESTLFEQVSFSPEAFPDMMLLPR
jgi:hypothetical protein